MSKVHQVVLLNGRPDVGAAVCENHFKVSNDLPPAVLNDGEIQIQLLCLSVDPYLRCRFNSVTGAEYLTPFEIGKPIVSGGVGRVVSSRDIDHYPVGCYVVSQMKMPWRSDIVVSPSAISDLKIVNPVIADPLLACGPLGVAGLSAYHCVTEQCKVQRGSVVIVSSCAGAVGTIAGQLMVQKGAIVIGICGSHTKCEWSQKIGCVTKAVCYKDADFETQLRNHCKEADVYLDNVGGSISECIIRMMDKGKVVVCGQISTYNQDTSVLTYAYPDALPAYIMNHMKHHSITRERFFVGWYHEKDKHALIELQSMISKGDLNIAVEWIDDLSRAGSAFSEMMTGKYCGKVLIRI